MLTMSTRTPSVTAAALAAALFAAVPGVLGQAAAGASHLRGGPGVEASDTTDEDLARMLTFVGAVLLVISYVALYLAMHQRYEANTPERVMLNRLMCCWADLYVGKATPLYNILFSPITLTIHAVRIYLFGVLSVYGRRVFWRAFGCCTSYFVDSEFPPESTSLGNVGGDFANDGAGKNDSEVTWVRAMDFGKADVRQRTLHPHLHNTEMCLFEGKIEAKDILQGRLGDCWLLAAMATLAEHEGAIGSLFLTPEVDPRGKYHIRLFDPQERRWKVIVVDDHIPCAADPGAADGVRRGADGAPEALYARPHGREIWAVLLEKAFAKLCGSYAAIEAGITEWGIVCMTGGSAWRYEAAAGGNAWQRSDLVAQEDNSDKRACGFRPTDELRDDEELFELLRFYHRQGSVLCCGGVKPDGQAQGLITKHAFSLLQVCTARKSPQSDQYFRFVQIRNPWGTGEWTGPWSDDSPEWENFPHVKYELGFEKSDDGAFWMQWEDFARYWSYVGCVDCNTDIHSMRLPLYRESEPDGPLKAAAQGCGRYWCLCAGAWHLFMKHEASSARLSSADFRSTCGVDPSGVYCRVCEVEAIHVEGRPGGQVAPSRPVPAKQVSPHARDPGHAARLLGGA
mmetsp:Transcript_103705/g.298628  ORF Transcript_103705/g.298628 Transcript_103705/m.298628 type:complete len:625 (-) Transcript_103705:74-1948(-)